MTDSTSSWCAGRKGWCASEFGRLDIAARHYFDARARRSRPVTLAGCRILEIGFGIVPFATWTHEQGAIDSDTESLPKILAAARVPGSEVHPVRDSLCTLFQPQSIDLSVAFDVFEHLRLEQLKATLREARTRLWIGGLLIERVPSGDSPFGRAIQNGDLTHIPYSCARIGSHCRARVRRKVRSAAGSGAGVSGRRPRTSESRPAPR